MTDDAGPFFSAAEVADYLGVHEKQIYRLMKKVACPAPASPANGCFPKGSSTASFSTTPPPTAALAAPSSSLATTTPSLTRSPLPGLASASSLSRGW